MVSGYCRRLCRGLVGGFWFNCIRRCVRESCEEFCHWLQGIKYDRECVDRCVREALGGELESGAEG